ncbi:hypothetical protein E05_22840 [Plautia stali symbiont]|nr:hypothetical protein E05_22840 [Plautia stali symbiont]
MDTWSFLMQGFAVAMTPENLMIALIGCFIGTIVGLIVRIMSLSTLKAPELWAGVRHEVGVKNDAELQSRHFPLLTQFLQVRQTLS